MFDLSTGNGRVSSSNEQSDVTTALAVIAGQEIGSGETVMASAPAAAFDVEITSDQLLEFRADSDSLTGVLDLRVVDPQGLRYNTSVVQPQSLPDRLPDEIVELFPAEVVELFAENGLPDTIAEATSMLTEAGLLEEVLAVLDQHPEAAAAIYGATPSRAGAAAATVVGGHGSGTYQVLVTSSDPERDITATLTPIQTQPLAPGDTVTATAPAAFDVTIAGRPLVFTTQTDSTDVLLGVEVLDPQGNFFPGSSTSSAAPGQPAIAIVGAYGVGPYRVIVTSSPEQSVVVAQLE